MAVLKDEGILCRTGIIRWVDITELTLIYVGKRLIGIRHKSNNTDETMFLGRTAPGPAWFLERLDGERIKSVNLAAGKSLVAYVALGVLAVLGVLLGPWSWVLAPFLALAYWFAIPPELDSKPRRLFVAFSAGALVLLGVVWLFLR